MKVLLVEDDKGLSSIIAKGLKEEKYNVETAYDGEQGEFLASVNDYDIMILDVRLPKMDGYSVCKNIRLQKNNVPIIMLTANDTVSQKVHGLDCGADDYLIKPFDFEELLARIRSLLRRKYLHDDPEKLIFDDLILNIITHKVYRNNIEIKLTTQEYKLLKYFMLNKERVLTRSMIGEHVWDMNFDYESNVIDVYINYLRAKIDKPFNKKSLHTLRGTGYILTNEN
jgi:DNA-binding response OmpR family regulator